MRTLLLLVAISGLQCTHPDPPVVVPPEGDVCELHCAAALESGCEWAEPSDGQDGIPGTPDDSTCLERCRYYQSLDPPPPMPQTVCE